MSNTVVNIKVQDTYKNGAVTQRVFNEIASHEGMVLEAYKDSVGVWTWGVGVTNASGHEVYPRYWKNPSTVERACEVSRWLMETKYGPAVVKAFKKPLTEEQFAAALSFHYNTGAIGRASWVNKFNSGDVAGAKAAIMNWKKPSEIIPRRQKERDLFFDGKWSNDGTCTYYPVVNNSGNIVWSKAKKLKLPTGIPSTPPTTEPPSVTIPPPAELPDVPQDTKNRGKVIAGVVVAVLTGVAATISGLIDWLKGLF